MPETSPTETVIENSFCVIVGNEAERIVKCLDAFGPSFQELSMVRAIGAQEPDETRQLAEDWCRANHKQFVFSEYKNSAAGAEFKHVDDFAAARNQSFRQASGKWLTWGDADDVVSPDTDIRDLNSAQANTTADVLHFQYDVPGTNKKPYRERSIRRELFNEGGRVWVFPLHENLSVRTNDKQEFRSSPIWLHAPEGKKIRSKDRNLKILSCKITDLPATLFYIHQEYFNDNKQESAREWGQKALMYSDLPPPFRYQILLNLARLARNHQEMLTHAGNAFAIMPHCREALAIMTLGYFQREDTNGSLSTTDTMVNIPLSTRERVPWTYEPKWYGWAGWDLRARALRLVARDAEADQAQKKVHGKGPYGFGVPTISLIHATRGRYQAAVNARNMWLDAAADASRVEHIFAIDADDETSHRALKQFQHVVVPTPGTCVKAWNAGAAISQGKIIVQLSDDWVPIYGWDTALLTMIADNKKDLARDQFVVAVSDGTRNDNLLCMAIMSRARYNAQGREMFSEEYESMFSDNEFTFRAYRDGVVIDCRDSIQFQHMHPTFGKGQWDETYERNNEKGKYERGQATFYRRNPDAQRNQKQIDAILAAVS